MIPGKFNPYSPDGKDGVSRTDTLQRTIEVDDQGTPQNVLSPARAKGLEFKRVVLYGFGEYMPEGFERFIDSLEKSENSLIDDSLLTYGYFINQLYVAASRPQKRLFIIDTESSIQKLWRFSTDPEFQAIILNKIKNGSEIWSGHLGSIQKGSFGSWTEDRENPEERAEQLELEGRSKPDSFLLRQAAMAYRQINNIRKFHLCRAKAFEIDENFQEAGNSYIEGENYEDAVQAFWKGNHYKEIANLSREKELRDSLETRIAVFLSDEASTAQCQKILNEIIERIDEDTKFLAKVTASQNWITSFEKILNRLLGLGSFSPEQLRININQLNVLSQNGVEINQEQIARLYRKTNDLVKAIEKFEAIGKAHLPECREIREAYILDEYRKNPKGKFSSEDIRMIAERRLGEKKYLESAQLFAHIGSHLEIARIINEVATDKKFSNLDLGSLAELFLKQLITNGQWISAIGFIKSLEHGALTGRALIRLKKVLKKAPVKWEQLFIEEVAVSQLLPVADNNHKTAVSDYLRLKVLDQPEQELLNLFHPLVVGAAFERAGRDIDTLQYYEKIQKYPQLSEAEKNIAVERWIKTKQKQALRERERGLEEKSEKHFLEASNKANIFQIIVEDLDEFPDISQFRNAIPNFRAFIEESSQIQPEPVLKSTSHVEKNSFNEKCSIVVDDFHIKFSRQLHRINVERESTMETASFSFENSLVLKSSDVTCQSKNGNIRVEDWSMEVVLLKNGGIQVDLLEKGLSIILKK